MKRGIYLVANLKSQDMCENLVYSIRESGCKLPIRLIHFGGREINSPYLIEQVERLYYADFPEEAKKFISAIRSVTDCPLGFLYRFLAFFADWDEFIYSDNDIVALCNWDRLFDYLPEMDLVHADEEYITKGQFNYDAPLEVEKIFGAGALETAITAGHIVIRKSPKMVADIEQAVKWFKEYPHIPKKHDQSLLHIASLLGQWRVLNLCKPPHNWLSSWAGDYKNSLDVLLQAGNNKISHIHYSGGTPKGDLPIEELLFSSTKPIQRLRHLLLVGLQKFSGIEYLQWQKHRIVRKVKSMQQKEVK